MTTKLFCCFTQHISLMTQKRYIFRPGSLSDTRSLFIKTVHFGLTLKSSFITIRPFAYFTKQDACLFFCSVCQVSPSHKLQGIYLDKRIICTFLVVLSVAISNWAGLEARQPDQQSIPAKFWRFYPNFFASKFLTMNLYIVPGNILLVLISFPCMLSCIAWWMGAILVTTSGAFPILVAW